MLTWRTLGALIAAGFLAQGAHANTCAPAAVKGTAPTDYQSYCWLDFSGYADATAQAGGQPFSFALPDGSTLSLTMQVSTDKASPAVAVHAVPSWTGSAIGHSAFSGIPGKPVLYETVGGSTVNVVLANILVTPPAGSGVSASYAIIAADGESSNQNESLSFTTNAQPWVQVAQIPNGAVYPTVAGVGTTTVTETGVAGTVGAFAFASFNNPTQISVTMKGGGLQGPMFAIRYASLAVSSQLNGTRGNAADQFAYSIRTVGGQTLASGATTGAAAGPFAPAVVPTVAAGYPVVVTETMAPGSTATLAGYAVALTCTNLATGASSTVLPVGQTASSFTFPSLQYGDALSCLFTNTANRANATIAKTGPATVNAGATLSYSLLAANSGPADASGLLVKDPAVANFTATAVACGAVTGGGLCPAPASLTLANLQGPGIVIPALPNGASVTLLVTGTAGNGSGNISNVATVVASPIFFNSNVTPTATAATTVTPAADAATTLAFPASANAGSTVTGTVTFGNAGLGAANGATFTLTLPAHLTAPPVLTGLPPGATYTYAPTTGVVALAGMPASVAAGATLAPIGVSYVQPGSAASTVTASFNTTSVDANPGNNAASAAVGGAALADLSTKLTLLPKVDAGQPVAGTVVFANNGPSAAAGVLFSLTLPPHLAVAPTISGLPPGAAATYAPATGVVSFTGLPNALASGASLGPIAFGYTQPPSGTSTVGASIGAATLDADQANNTAAATTTGAAAQLMGTVYTDNNQDALFDAGDAPVAGAAVQLLRGNVVVATAVTSATGAYLFAGQVPGSYTVAATPLPGNLADTPSPVPAALGVGTVGTVNFGQIPAAAAGRLMLTKTTPLTAIAAGQSVPYTITAVNTQKTGVPNATVTDLIPAGFRYRAGSGSVNGRKLEPAVSGRKVTWTPVPFAAGETKVFTLVLTAGAGVVSGEFVNQAMAYNTLTGGLISNVAGATVRIVADPTFDCPDLIGKVFDDANANGVEDPGEKGIAGVRLVTAQGLLETTDAEGRYHIVCPRLPDSALGTNFILKLDERTLPSGYRLTTDNPDTVRLTAGKVSKLNFGATIHHVVRIEVSGSAFDGENLRPETAARIDSAVAAMQQQAFVVRLAYVAADESPTVLQVRLHALQTALAAAWKAHRNPHPLRTEEEILRPAPRVPPVAVQP